MNRKDRGALIGMCIGDGYLRPPQTKNSCVGLYLEHSIKQKDYLLFKCGVLNSIFGGKKIKVNTYTRFDKRTNKFYGRCIAYKTHKYFRILRKRLYPNNIKTYSRQILNWLTPEGIAYWYFDDGGCKVRYNKKTNKISSCQTYLYTYCSRLEAEIIQKYFIEEHSIFFAIHTRKNGHCCLCANTENSKKFIALIEDYKIPCMAYKFKHVISTRVLSPSNEGEDIVQTSPKKKD